MTRPSVWAPRALRVELVTSGEREPMKREGAWWRAARALAPGTDYAFAIDGGAPLPDPRSRFQPEGPHGPSRVVDLSGFAWTDEGFVAPPLGRGAIYELHVGTFTPEGTLDAAVLRLDAIALLGATHVELMPLADFPGERGWGYDGVGLFAVHRAYGGPEALARFVDAAHARGLGVLLDVVYNHLGPEGNYLPRFGPYFRDGIHTPWGWAPNLDGPGSDEVRAFFVDNALLWLRDHHVDGLRLDAVDALVDRTARHLLEELEDAVEALARETGRALVLIAESDANDPRIVRERERGGYGLAAQWCDDFHRALHAWLCPSERAGYYVDFGALEQVRAALEGGYVLRGQHCVYRGRRHGREPGAMRASALVVYAQNHDLVGNRPRGARLASIAGEARARVAAGLTLLSPYVPLVFMGEEWAASTPFHFFVDYGDARLLRDVARGRAEEQRGFGWEVEPSDPAPGDPLAMERSRLAWSERTSGAHGRMLEWYRALLALRRAHEDLHDPDPSSVRAWCDTETDAVVLERASTIVVARRGEGVGRVRVSAGEVLLACGDVALEGGALVMGPTSFAALARR